MVIENIAVLRLKELFSQKERTILSIMQQLSKEGLVPRSQFYKLMDDTFTQEERLARKKIQQSLSSKASPNTLKPSGETSSGTRVSSYGYTLIRKPSWYTGQPDEVFVEQHMVIYCELHGPTEIPRGYQVHHKDFNKLNNLPENLILLTISEHTKVHWQHQKLQDIDPTN